MKKNQVIYARSQTANLTLKYTLFNLQEREFSKSRESQIEWVQCKGWNSWAHKCCAVEAANVNMDGTYFCMSCCMND